MLLYEKLNIPRGVTAVIGSGGKTTLLRTLSRELPGTVLLATTTHILPFEGVPLVTDGGEAVFSCETHLESVLSLDKCALTVLLAEWQGFSVPESAVTSGEDGDGVYRVSGPIREYVPVTVLARRNGFALVASPMLRGGMTVLLFPAAEAAS